MSSIRSGYFCLAFAFKNISEQLRIQTEAIPLLPVAEHRQQKSTPERSAFPLDAPRPGFEPGTNSLTGSCSTVELSRNIRLSSHSAIAGRCSSLCGSPLTAAVHLSQQLLKVLRNGSRPISHSTVELSRNIRLSSHSAERASVTRG